MLSAFPKTRDTQPYEFGVKVNAGTTHRECLVVGMRSLPTTAIRCQKPSSMVSILRAQKPKAVFVDNGYRGFSVDGVTIWCSGQKRGVTPSIRKAIHRRSADDPVIGHMKNRGGPAQLDRNSVFLSDISAG